MDTTFRPMRRKNQLLPEAECLAILNQVTNGVLALSGDHGYPYAVPLSYVYANGKLYFHGAKQGHKLDAVRRESKASFCVVDQDIVQPEKYATLYRSVIVFGKIRVLEDPAEIRAAIEMLGLRYAPDNPREMLDKEIDTEWPALCMFEMTVEHMTGKEAKALTAKRRQDPTV